MRQPWKLRQSWLVHPCFRQLRFLRQLDFEASSLVCILLFCFILPIKYPTARTYEYLKLDEISEDLQICSSYQKTKTARDWCPLLPQNLGHFKQPPHTVNLTSLHLMVNRTRIQPGGHWAPNSCIPWQKVAIIVPFRDREKQLHHFLQHMHPFLQAQCLDYTIFVIEQNGKHDFNRGKLFNIGFKEASRDPNYCCFIFHDVDLLPESPEHIYGCSSTPRHMCSAINTFRYILPYPELFGGVVAFSKHQFEDINGYSNLYFGWGGEDDDLYKRVAVNKWKVRRWEPGISRYTMLRHAKAAPNPERFKLLMHTQYHMLKDGLNTLKYEVTNQKLHPLYTWILVDVDPFTIIINPVGQ